MKDKIFGVLQRVGRSFMLPIAILPVAGLFLGIGGAFTNETMLKTYHLEGLLGSGTAAHYILQVLNDCGNIVFANLPLIFAIGIAIGMAKKEKDVAALAGAIAYFVMNAAIGAMAVSVYGTDGVAERVREGAMTSVLGITSLQTGVFGGILVGLGTAALHNRFYKIRLPQVLSFFGGTRFVPIVSAAVYLIVGILLFFIWPPIQSAITYIGELVQNSGYLGTFVYGLTERALIPFGLHHVFYLPFWQTNVGGTMEILGRYWEGAQNIFFAQLSDPSVEHFAVSATRFMSGKFPFMIFGLPGAALAMYQCAKPQKRKTVGGLLLSAALTSMLTGITEPLEFTFLFAAPLLYVLHCVLAGLSYMLTHLFQVGVGMTFSGGLIDLFLFGVLQGNAKTDWINILWIGLFYFVIYYLIFRYLIIKLHLKTPGREADGEEAKLYTRADMETKKKQPTPKGSHTQAKQIVQGLGGRKNISDLDCCATRLRITVVQPQKVDQALLRTSGASGVIQKGNGLQIIYGPSVTVIKSDVEDYLLSKEKTTKEKPSFIEVFSPLSGSVVPLKSVKDEAFSQGILGDGIAILPKSGKLYAPIDGIIDHIADSKHAIGLRTKEGLELLMHIGLDTVKLGGDFYTLHVKPKDRVHRGDLLIEFDMDGILKQGFDLTTPIVLCDAPIGTVLVQDYTKELLNHGDPLFRITLPPDQK